MLFLITMSGTSLLLITSRAGRDLSTNGHQVMTRIGRLDVTDAMIVSALVSLKQADAIRAVVAQRRTLSGSSVARALNASYLPV